MNESTQEKKYKNFVGIDVGKASLDICILDKNKIFQIKNNEKEILKFLRKDCPKDSLVALEATGGYEIDLCIALDKKKFDFARCNPLHVRRFAQCKAIKAKTDKIDARLIADYAKICRPHESMLKDSQTRKLSALARRRNQLIGMITAERNRFSKERDAWLKNDILSLIDCFKKNLEQIDKECAKVIQETPEKKQAEQILRSVPGVGPVVSQTLLCEMPELGKIGAGKITALAGLAPFNRDSGKYKGKRFIGGGRPMVRRVLYMGALVAMRRNPEIKKFYDKLIDSGKKPKVALVACMRKMLLIMHSMLKYKTYWKKISLYERFNLTLKTVTTLLGEVRRAQNISAKIICVGRCGRIF